MQFAYANNYSNGHLHVYFCSGYIDFFEALYVEFIEELFSNPNFKTTLIMPS